MGARRPVGTVQEAATQKVAPGGFALATVGYTPGCSRCHGVTRLAVRTSLGVAGYLSSEYPWECDIPDSVDDHPTTPHYRMDWGAEDVHGNPLPVDTTTLHFAARKIAALAHTRTIESVHDSCVPPQRSH